MASTSELQDVRAEIKELKAQVKVFMEQIEAADLSKRLDLLEKLIAPLQDRLATLQKKEERLAAQLSAGAASSSGQAGAMSEVQVQQDAVAVQLQQQQLQVQQRQLQLLQQIATANLAIANNTSNTQRLLLVSRHRYTPSQASKIRDPTFKKRLAEVYQCNDPEPSAEPKKLRCMLLDRFLPSDVVCGSHLFKYSWHEDVSNTLGFTNINDTRNGLLLFKPLEEAFDNGYLVFLPAGDNFTAHWLGDDSSQLAQPPFPWNRNSSKQGKQDEPDKLPASIRADFKGTTFKEVVEGKQLHFRNEHRPYKRCLSYQARKAVAAALSTGRISEDWLQGKTLVFHSPAASNIEDYFASIPPEGADVPPEAGSIPHDDSSQAENVTNSDS